MNIEFLKDSVELATFVESCRKIDDVNHENEEDRHFFDRIYQAPDGKTYSVECVLRKGIKTKSEFRSHRRDFKHTEPYIVLFHEVVPVEVTETVWECVD
jgi:hypothetical protein